MSFIIQDKNEFFVGYCLDGIPAWSNRPDVEHVAQQFTTKEEAISIREELRALGLNPKIVNWKKRAKKQTIQKGGGKGVRILGAGAPKPRES
jgi:hypothetical protein